MVIQPTPTPVATPTPVPTPTPTATPDVANAPFDMESTALTVAGTDVTLMTGVDETGERLYPLCGIAEVLGYDYTHENGAWATHARGRRRGDRYHDAG